MNIIHNYMYHFTKILIIFCLFTLGIGCLSDKDVGSVEIKQLSPEEMYTSLQKKRLSEASNGQIKVQVSFHSWLSPEELYLIIDTNKSFYLIQVNTFMSTVKNGWKSPLRIGKHRDRENFYIYLNQKITSLNEFDTQLALEIKQAIDNGEIQIGSIVMEGDRDDIEKWWNSHESIIRVVQLITGPAEESQPTYHPGELFQ